MTGAKANDMVRAMPLTAQDYMALALSEARAAADRQEVPVGAVVVDRESGDVVARNGNRTIELADPTAHAEILVIREACKKINNYRLVGCDIYVTLEPCGMCATAISLARFDRLMFGAGDEKGGAVVHGALIFDHKTCHHRPEVLSGMGAGDAAQLLKDFFAARRSR